MTQLPPHPHDTYSDQEVKDEENVFNHGRSTAQSHLADLFIPFVGRLIQNRGDSAQITLPDAVHKDQKLQTEHWKAPPSAKQFD